MPESQLNHTRSLSTTMKSSTYLVWWRMPLFFCKEEKEKKFTIEETFWVSKFKTVMSADSTFLFCLQSYYWTHPGGESQHIPSKKSTVLFFLATAHSNSRTKHNKGTKAPPKKNSKDLTESCEKHLNLTDALLLQCIGPSIWKDCRATCRGTHVEMISGSPHKRKHH